MSADGLTTVCSDSAESIVKKSFLLMAALAITFTTQGAANAQQRADDGKSAAEIARETIELLEAWEAEEAAAKEAAEAKAAKEAAAAKGVPKERPPVRVEGGKVVYDRAGKCVVIDLPLGEPPSKAAKDAAKKAKAKAADEREEFEALAEHEMHGFRPMNCHYCEDDEVEAWYEARRAREAEEAAEACRRAEDEAREAEEARARAKIDKAVKKALNNPVYRKFLQQYGTPAVKAALDKALQNQAREMAPEPDPKKYLEALQRMGNRYRTLYPPSPRNTPDFQPSEGGVRERARQEMEERLREAELTRPRTTIGVNPCAGRAVSVPAPQPCSREMKHADPPVLAEPVPAPVEVNPCASSTTPAPQPRQPMMERIDPPTFIRPPVSPVK